MANRHGGHTGESDAVEPSGCNRARASNTGDVREKIQVFLCGEIFINADAMAQEANLAPCVFAAGRFAENVRGAALKRRQSCNYAQQRRISRAIAADTRG